MQNREFKGPIWTSQIRPEIPHADCGTQLPATADFHWLSFYLSSGISDTCTVEGNDLTANQGTVTTVLLECKNCLENEEHTHRSIYARYVSRVCEPHDTDHITLLQYMSQL